MPVASGGFFLQGNVGSEAHRGFMVQFDTVHGQMRFVVVRFFPGGKNTFSPIGDLTACILEIQRHSAIFVTNVLLQQIPIKREHVVLDR